MLGKDSMPLFDSRAAISLMGTNIYNMVEDCYKTSILLTAIHLIKAEGLPMTPIGKATLHLHTAHFKFSHTLIYVRNYQKLIFYLASISRKDTLYFIVGTLIDNHSYREKAHS